MDTCNFEGGDTSPDVWTIKKLQRPQIMDTPPFKNLLYGQFRFHQFTDIIVLRDQGLKG